MSRHDSKKISDVKVLLKMGSNGSGIASIEKTGSTLNVDTYTITFDDGTKTTFTVTNGTSIESIEKTSTEGRVDTYTITLTDGSTSTFEVTNGEGSSASSLPYDNTISELTATNVQDAIDEIDATVDDIDAEIADMNNILGAKNLILRGFGDPTHTIDGLTYTVDDNTGIITINGTNTNSGYSAVSVIYAPNKPFFKDMIGKELIVSFNNGDVMPSGCYGYLQFVNGSTIIRRVNVEAGEKEKRITVPTVAYDTVTIRIVVNAGVSLSNKAFYPMVRLASIKDETYTPSAMTNKQLTDRLDATHHAKTSSRISIKGVTDYIAPYDGYVTIQNSGATSGSDLHLLVDGLETVLAYKANLSTYSLFNTYVRKGMKITDLSNLNSYNCFYTPIE